MGEANRRKNQIEALKNEHQIWFESMNEQEQKILDLAVLIDEKLVRGRKFYEGCYHIAFFMSKFLQENGIVVQPVVGWVNDGQWAGVASHAWIEFDGKRTDVSLGFTLHPDAQPTGDMIVHDRIIRKGTATYTYFQNDHPDALIRLENLRANPVHAKVLARKDVEHKYMMSIMESRHFDAYLSQAPSGLRYNDLLKLIF